MVSPRDTARARRRPVPRVAEKEIHQRWMSFLLAARSSIRNDEVLSDYFFQHTCSHPDVFYRFVEFLQLNLENKKTSPRGRTRLQPLSGDDREKLARQYLNIVSGLCERFGFFVEKVAMDDLCFSILEPEHYHEISQLFFQYQKKSQATVKRIIQVLDTLLSRAGHVYEMNGRYKNLYSIYKKFQKRPKGSPLQLNDIFAFRIIVQSNREKECFEVLNLLHDSFHPLPDFFRDYISIPKINGYQSLHTGLTRILSDLDLPVEVQIRTRAMHDFAENGLAAHWAYSRTKSSSVMTEKEQKLLDHFSSTSDLSHTGEEKMVHFFSKDGDFLALPLGATVLDFAYSLHTEMGHRAIGVLVKQYTRPLDTVISEGDMLEIVSSENYTVEPSWLSIATTPEAKKKIMDHLKKHNCLGTL